MQKQVNVIAFFALLLTLALAASPAPWGVSDNACLCRQ